MDESRLPLYTAFCKRALFVCLVAACLLICGCNYKVGGDLRPDACIPSVWVSETPSIQIYYTDEYQEKDPNELSIPLKPPVCYVTVDGEQKECEVFLDHGGSIWFTLDTNHSMNGLCDFEEGRFTVEVERETDTLFGGKYQQIRFTMDNSRLPTSEQ